jgi:Holliday junction resolvase RusA-like endonuclease
MAVTQFSFRVPGQPPSWNTSYRMRKANVKDRFGQPVIGDDLRKKTVSRLFKTDEARSYQDGVQMIARTARPSGFAPKGQIVVAYTFMLKRDMDCDNIMKMLNDAIAKALGVNDSRFLPVVLGKGTGVQEPFVSVAIFDEDHHTVSIA